jgi:DNA repair protein RadC
MIRNLQPISNLVSSLEYAETFRNIWKKHTIDCYESVYAICLDSQKRIIKAKRINEGNLYYTSINIRKAIDCALRYNSFYVLIAHNHTIENLEPSEKDIEETSRLVSVLAAVEISLIDHIILTPQNYFSFRDSGLLSLQKTG